MLPACISQLVCWAQAVHLHAISFLLWWAAFK